MKKRKIMMSVMSAALVGVVAIGGTLAYLSDTTDKVTNTFNVGSGYITDKDHTGLWLDETAKTGDTNPVEIDLENRTELGVEYTEMLPGSVVAKDPTFHLTTGSTDSYVFALVKGVDAMITDGYYFTATKPEGQADPQNAFNGAWKKVSVGSGFDGLYIYFDGEDNIVEGGELDEEGEVVTPADPMLSLFNWVKLGSSLDNAEFADVNPGLVEIKGVAVQAANLTPAQAQEEAERVLNEIELHD